MATPSNRRTFSKVHMIYLSELQDERLRGHAATRKIKINQVVRQALDRFLDEAEADQRQRVEQERAMHAARSMRLGRQQEVLSQAGPMTDPQEASAVRAAIRRRVIQKVGPD